MPQMSEGDYKKQMQNIPNAPSYEQASSLYQQEVAAQQAQQAARTQSSGGGTTVTVRNGETVAQANARSMGATPQEVARLSPSYTGADKGVLPGADKPVTVVTQTGQVLPNFASSGFAAKIAADQAKAIADAKAVQNNPNLIKTPITEAQYYDNRVKAETERYKGYGYSQADSEKYARGNIDALNIGERTGHGGAITDIKLAHTAADAATASAENRQNFLYPQAKSFFEVTDKNPQMYEKGATNVPTSQAGLDALGLRNNIVYAPNANTNTPTTYPNTSTSIDNNSPSKLKSLISFWDEGSNRAFTNSYAPTWVKFGLAGARGFAGMMILPFKLMDNPKETVIGVAKGFTGLPKAFYNNPVETSGELAGGIMAGGVKSPVNVKFSEAKITGEAPKTGMFEMAEAAKPLKTGKGGNELAYAQPEIIAPKGYEVKPTVETITPTRGNVIGGTTSYQYFPDTASIKATPKGGLMSSIGNALGLGKGKGNAPVSIGGVSSRVLEGAPASPSSVAVKAGQGFGKLNIDLRAVQESTAAESTPVIGPDGKYYYKAKAPTDETGAQIDVSKLAEVNAAAANYAGLKSMAPSAPETPWRGAWLQIGSGQGGRGVYPLVGLSGDTVVLGSKLPEGALSGLEKSLGGYEGMKVEGPLELKLIKENIISKYPEAERANIERTFDIRSANFGQKSDTIAPELPIQSVLELHELKPETIKNVKSWFDEQSLAYEDTGYTGAGSVAQAALTGFMEEGKPMKVSEVAELYQKQGGRIEYVTKEQMKSRYGESEYVMGFSERQRIGSTNFDKIVIREDLPKDSLITRVKGKLELLPRGYGVLEPLTKENTLKHELIHHYTGIGSELNAKRQPTPELGKMFVAEKQPFIKTKEGDILKNEDVLKGRPFRSPHDFDFYIKDSLGKSKELMSIIEKTEPKGTVWFKKEGSSVIESKKGTIFDIHDLEKPLEEDISSSLTSSNKEGYLAFGYKAEAPVKVGNTYAVSLSEQATRKMQGFLRLRKDRAAPAEHRFKDLPDSFSAEMKATESRGAVKSLLKPKETTRAQIMESEKFWTNEVLKEKPEVQSEYFQKLKANMPESIARIKAEQPELYEKFKLGEPLKEMPKTEEPGMFLYSKKLKAETGTPSFRTVALSSSQPSAERKSSAAKRNVLDTGSISPRGNLYTGSVRSSGYSRARNVLSTGSISSGFKSPSPKKSPYSGMSSGGSSYTSPKSSPPSYSPARSVLSTGSISSPTSPRSSSPRSPYSYKSSSPSSKSPYGSPSSYSSNNYVPKSPSLSRPYGGSESKKSDLIDVFKEKKGGKKDSGLAIHPRADPLSRMISEIKTGKTAQDPLPTRANSMKFMREVTRGGQIFQTRGGAEKGGLLPPIKNILGRAKGKKGGFW